MTLEYNKFTNQEQDSERHTYLRQTIEGIRKRTKSALEDGRRLEKEISDCISEMIRLKRHFNRMQREYTEFEDTLIEIEKEYWELEQKTGWTPEEISREVAIPQLVEKAAESTVLDDIFGTPEPVPKKEVAEPVSILDDIFKL